jgi:hypothetical protein
MADEAVNVEDGYEGLDPKVYGSIMLASLVTMLLKKKLLTIEEAGELAKDVAETAKAAAADVRRRRSQS